MTTEEYQLCQDLMQLMVKYKAIGFVGTFYMQETNGFSTIDMVQPGYDNSGFKALAASLDIDIAKVFGGTNQKRENGLMRFKGHSE
jgi:hypothetical protein